MNPSQQKKVQYLRGLKSSPLFLDESIIIQIWKVTASKRHHLNLKKKKRNLMETMIGTANFNCDDIVRLRHNIKKDKILYINMRRLILPSQMY